MKKKEGFFLNFTGELTWPLIIVCVLIAGIALFWTMGIAKKQAAQSTIEDQNYSETVENHPTMLNPIIWCYLIAGIFITFVVFYNILAYR